MIRKKQRKLCAKCGQFTLDNFSWCKFTLYNFILDYIQENFTPENVILDITLECNKRKDRKILFPKVTSPCASLMPSLRYWLLTKTKNLFCVIFWSAGLFLPDFSSYLLMWIGGSRCRELCTGHCKLCVEHCAVNCALLTVDC